MQFKAFLISIPVGVFLCSMMTPHLQLLHQGNTPPKIVITKPSKNDKFDWNSLISYSITVEDKEDGASKYNEIAANEVLLKITYLPDYSALKTALATETKSPEPRELSYIKTSGCFNCHAVKSKLIGPSFEAIAKRYPYNTRSITLLANKIIKGSEAVWGTEKMPPHPDVTAKKAAEIIRWVLKTGADPNVNYLPGLEGAFYTRAKPVKNAGKGIYILSASYTDHGLPQMPQQNKQGKYTIVLRSNK